MLALTMMLWSVALGEGAAARAADAGDPGAASGGTLVIRKCTGADGAVRFQSTACPVGSAQAWSRSEPIAPPPSVNTTRAARTEGRASPLRGRGYASRGANPDNASTRRARCESARAEAARKRDREWNRLKFDDLSRLDAWVVERCR